MILSEGTKKTRMFSAGEKKAEQISDGRTLCVERTNEQKAGEGDLRKLLHMRARGRRPRRAH